MKRRLTYLTILMTALSMNAAIAQDTDEALKEIEEQQEALDEQASATADGRQQVEDRLKDKYGVDDATIADLRGKNFGYGEIDTALSLAERMEGGVNDANIQRIVDMRDENKGWGEIAHEFDVTVGDLRRKSGAAGNAAERFKENFRATDNLPQSPQHKSPKGPRGK